MLSFPQYLLFLLHLYPFIHPSQTYYISVIGYYMHAPIYVGAPTQTHGLLLYYNTIRISIFVVLNRLLARLGSVVIGGVRVAIKGHNICRATALDHLHPA